MGTSGALYSKRGDNYSLLAEQTHDGVYCFDADAYDAVLDKSEGFRYADEVVVVDYDARRVRFLDGGVDEMASCTFEEYIALYEEVNPVVDSQRQWMGTTLDVMVERYESS